MDNIPPASPEPLSEALSQPEAPFGARRESLSQKSGFAAGIALAYLLFYRLTLLLQTGQIMVVAFTTLFSLVLVLLFTVAVARSVRSPKALALNLLFSGVLALPLVLIPLLIARFPAPGWREFLTSPLMRGYGSIFRAIPGSHGLVLIWFASTLGVLISRLVKEMKILLPMAVVLAMVDLYVVFGGGLVTQAQSGKAPVANAAMQALTVRLPTAQPKGGAAPMQLAVGFADFLFIGVFFACFARFGIPSRLTFQVMCGVLISYMVVVALTGWALPALVPIAVVVIGMNLRQFRYDRSEAFALLYAGLIVAAIMTFLFFSSKR